MNKIGMMVFIALITACGNKSTDVDDLSKLQGTWVVETVTEDGNSIPPLIGATFTFSEDKLAIQIPNMETLHGKVQIQPADPLKHMLIEPDPLKEGCTSQNNAYELTDDTFTLIQAAPPKIPTDLSDKGQQRLVLKREEP